MSDRSERVDRLILEHASYNGQEAGVDADLPIARVTEIRRELVQIFQPEPDVPTSG